VKKAGSKLARARLRRRRANLDVKIARVRRKVKGLEKKLKRQKGILSRRLTARKRMK